MTRTQRLSSAILRLAAVIGLPLLLATTAAAQASTDAPAKEQAVAPADAPAPAAVEERADAPTLNRDVKQDLSRTPSSPEGQARQEEPLKEEPGPAMLQPYVEPEPPATPQP